jgi:macrolide phosphotransferase
LNVGRPALILAALAADATPGKKYRHYLLAQPTETLEILRLWDESGDSFELKIPRTPNGESELALEQAVLKALKPFASELPFQISEYAGQTRDFDGTKAIVFTLLGGNAPDLAKLGPGPFSTTFGNAMAAIHNLPLGTIRDAGLPEYDSATVLHSKVAELDKVAGSGRVPAILLTRWERALEDIGLFRFHPTITHGAISGDAVLIENQQIVGLNSWGSVGIADPAEDFRWLAGGGLPSTFDDAMIHYRSVRPSADENIAQRATLYSELELATWLLHCISTGDASAIKQAEDMIEDLRGHLEAGNLRDLTATSFVGLVTGTSLLSEITSDQAEVAVQEVPEHESPERESMTDDQISENTLEEQLPEESLEISLGLQEQAPMLETNEDGQELRSDELF